MIDEIVPPLARFSKASLSGGVLFCAFKEANQRPLLKESGAVVLSAFKEATVRPLLMKADLYHDVFKNYRLVPNLLFLSKMLEKIVLARLSRHFVGNSLLKPLQSDYRLNHSTQTALLKLVSDMLCSADQGRKRNSETKMTASVLK